MFDAIAKRYDLLNHVLSVGLDVRWRARAIREAELVPDARVLDLCTGTADFAIAAVHAAPRARVLGVDFAAAMLGFGLGKLRARALDRQITLVRGDVPAPPVFAATISSHGFTAVRAVPLSLGIVYLYVATRRNAI